MYLEAQALSDHHFKVVFENMVAEIMEAFQKAVGKKYND